MCISPWGIKNTHMYSLNDHVLETVNDNPYLGLGIISNTTNRASTALGLLRRNLKFLPKHHKTVVFQALVRPILEYGSIVWDSYLQKDIESLESVQRRAARFILSDYKTRSQGFMTQVLKELKLSTLQQSRLFNRLCFFYKIANGLVPAMTDSEYLTSVDNKRRKRSKQYSGYLTDIIVLNRSRINSKCFVNINAKYD